MQMELVKLEDVVVIIQLKGNPGHKLTLVDKIQYKELASIQVKNRVRFSLISLSLILNKKAYLRTVCIGSSQII